MHFASPLPWWLVAIAAAGVASLAVYSYRRPLVPLTRGQRGALVALRGLVLVALLLLLWRPVLLLPPKATGDIVIPVLVDVSRSMRVPDADGDTRIARATTLLTRELLPTLAQQAKVELYRVGQRVEPAAVDSLQADDRSSDLAGAIASIRDRMRGRRVAGIVLLSDGGDTGSSTLNAHGAGGTPPVFAVGIGSADGLPDREVTGLSASDPRVDQALIDLHVTAVARGFGRTPFLLRILANGQVVESRRVAPAAEGSPVEETFAVSPDAVRATVYTAEIAAEADESVKENNTRSVIVNPPGRKRRVLVLAGAPGFEYSFLIRALTEDPGLEIDSIVRKGKNDQNQDTFLVQAGGGRAPTLTAGFPATKEALFAYDAVVVANIEGDFFTRAQLELTAQFVSERGGGLLVLGGRAFERNGLMATPLEEVLPVELNERRGAAVRGEPTEEAPIAHDVIQLTEQGQTHPIMRIGAPGSDLRKLWAELPALAAIAPLGGPRPGAVVLAVAAAPGGNVMPVVAVQRYGRGRSMVFAGEASWRWRMMQPSTDRRYEFFWRQSLRWLTSDAPDPVTLDVPADVEPGDGFLVDVGVRDRAFAPVSDAVVNLQATAPGGASTPAPTRPNGAGRFVATVTPDRPGLYRLQVEAQRGTEALGETDHWMYVGGAEREFADPRLNEGFLRRLARESGGQYVRAADVSRVIADLQKTAPPNTEPERRDLWHEPWAFALILAALSAEWIFRRLWGLR